MSFKLGNRYQHVLFPTSIDEYIKAEDPVRVYDKFVDALDFQELGISLTPQKGQEAYYPREMLKLIIYGYSYGTQSARKLERACYHNLSFIWLMGGMKPDFRTIARFRDNHKEAIKLVLKQTVDLCKKLGLIEGNVLFIDGTSIKAKASLENTWTKEKCDKKLKKIDENIERLVEEAQRIDANESTQGSLVKVREDLVNEENQRRIIEEVVKTLNEKPQKNASHNTTDPDCTKVTRKHQTKAAYNVQVVVDNKHGLIVHTDATSKNPDAGQLNDQLKKAAENLGKMPGTIVADSGYYSVEDINQVDQAVTVIIPSQRQAHSERTKPEAKAFKKEQFIYDEEKDEYRCPNNKVLTYISTDKTDRNAGRRKYGAKATDCGSCQYFGICTKSKSGRRLQRHKLEHVINRLQKTYDDNKALYKKRKEKAELPNAYFKCHLGVRQFLLTRNAGTNAEVSIYGTCFDIVRMINIFGIHGLLEKLEQI